MENFRVLPVLGPDAVKVSPRVGHLHVTVDDLPWHWGDFSNDNSTIVVVGMPPGPHKVMIELADPEHGQTVTFTVPGAEMSREGGTRKGRGNGQSRLDTHDTTLRPPAR